MSPIPDSNLLFPSQGVESPLLQIWCHRFLQPFAHAAFILIPPEVNVFGIPHAGRIYMVQSDREEGLPVRSDQPPVMILIFQREEVG